MTLASLPEDLQVNIFVQLPMKSIISCRCVCKVWRYMLHNPKFIKHHLDKAIHDNKDNPSLIFTTFNRCWPQYRIYTMNYASIFLRLSSKSSSVDFPFEYMQYDYVKILGSCRGLVCLLLYQVHYLSVYNTICLWNPCTGEYKRLPSHEFSSSSVSTFYSGYGFGYDFDSDDYKLVCIQDSFQVLVYTLGSDSWKSIQTRNSYIIPRGGLNPGLCFNGALHWSCCSKETSKPVIVSFDTSSEELIELPFPELHPSILASLDASSINLGVSEDRLCLVSVEPRVRVDMWVMQVYGVTGSWTKLFTTTHETIKHCRKLKPIWSSNSGVVLMDTRDDKILFINPTDGTIIEAFSRNPKISMVRSYVESLVPLNSGTYIEKIPKPKQNSFLTYF